MITVIAWSLLLIVVIVAAIGALEMWFDWDGLDEDMEQGAEDFTKLIDRVFNKK